MLTHRLSTGGRECWWASWGPGRPEWLLWRGVPRVSAVPLWGGPVFRATRGQESRVGGEGSWGLGNKGTREICCWVKKQWRVNKYRFLSTNRKARNRMLALWAGRQLGATGQVDEEGKKYRIGKKKEWSVRGVPRSSWQMSWTERGTGQAHEASMHWLCPCPQGGGSAGGGHGRGAGEGGASRDDPQHPEQPGHAADQWRWARPGRGERGAQRTGAGGGRRDGGRAPLQPLLERGRAAPGRLGVPPDRPRVVGLVCHDPHTASVGQHLLPSSWPTSSELGRRYTERRTFLVSK